MSKSMAQVLEECDAHQPTHRTYKGGWWELACTACDFALGRRLSHLDHTPHHAHRAEIFAAELSAAGFGLVADAKAEAWDEGVEEAASRGVMHELDAPDMRTLNPYREARRDDQ